MLLVGGGAVAWQKLQTLEPSGANVLVAAPRFDATFAAKDVGWTGDGQLVRLPLAFSPEMLSGMSLVIAATDDPALNHRVVELARGRGIWANAVDDPAYCDFYTPAVIRRGVFTLALGSDGGFPGLVRALRRVLELWLPAQDEPLLRKLVTLRRRLLQALPDAQQRQQALRQVAEQVEEQYLAPAVREAAGGFTPCTPTGALGPRPQQGI